MFQRYGSKHKRTKPNLLATRFVKCFVCSFAACVDAIFGSLSDVQVYDSLPKYLKVRCYLARRYRHGIFYIHILKLTHKIVYRSLQNVGLTAINFHSETRYIGHPCQRKQTQTASRDGHGQAVGDNRVTVHVSGKSLKIMRWFA